MDSFLNMFYFNGFMKKSLFFGAGVLYVAACGSLNERYLHEPNEFSFITTPDGSSVASDSDIIVKGTRLKFNDAQNFENDAKLHLSFRAYGVDNAGKPVFWENNKVHHGNIPDFHTVEASVEYMPIYKSNVFTIKDFSTQFLPSWSSWIAEARYDGRLAVTRFDVKPLEAILIEHKMRWK